MKMILLLLVLLYAVNCKQTILRGRELFNTTDYFECILIEISTDYEEDLPDELEFEHICQGKGPNGDFDMIYSIDDNNGVIPDLDETGLDIMNNSGRYKLTLTNIIENSEAVITTTPDTTVELVDLEAVEDYQRQHDRRLVSRSGVNSLAILRISGTNNKQPKHSASELSDAFFGTHGDRHNLKNRYELCSFGKLSFKPGVGNHFRNGVMEVAIDNPIEGQNVFTLLNVAGQAMKAKTGQHPAKMFDHVVYVFPRGTTYGNGGIEGWVGYAAIASFFSVFNDEMAMMLSHQVHEIGHNLGLSHSKHAIDEYGDQSGFMGRGYDMRDGPQMCFNGAKFWELGWFSSKATTVNPNSGSRSIYLSFFGDYNKVPNNSNDEVVLITVGDYHLLYNKKKGFNSESQEFGDKVTITWSQRSMSRAEAALGQGDKFSLNANSKNVVVEFCKATSANEVDKAMLSIYPSGSSSTCNNFDAGLSSGGSPPNPPHTPPATRPPTQQPVAAPTRAPTKPPTQQQVTAPTRPPTSPPTLTPFVLPFLNNPGVNLYCASDEMKVEVKLTANDSPGLIAWRLKKRRGDTIDQKNKNYYGGQNQEYIHPYCVKKSDIFEFHLKDFSGRQNPGGHYSISVDGEIYSEGDVVKEEIDYIQGKCGSANKSRMQFILNTGTAPERVSWTLAENGNTKYSGGPWGIFAGIPLHFFSNTCLDNSQCYTLTVRSHNGLDGGSYEINWNKENVKFSTFDSGDKEVTRFGNCGDDYYAPPELEEEDNKDCTCSDEPIGWMIAKGWECEGSYYLNTKCNKNKHWTKNKYCQLSCYNAGNGYPGDHCTCK